MITVAYETFTLHVHNVSADAKSADNLLKIVKAEIVYCKETLEVITIACVSDAGGDSRAMRVRLHKEMPWIICLDCFAHQINLVVGDYLTSNPELVATADRALKVIKWFNNHSRALGLLRKRMLQSPLKKILALIFPVITRWTAHYCAVNRLLQISKAMRTCCISDEEELVVAAGKKASQKAKATEILAIIADSSFWENLVRLRNHLEPLTIAANVTQASPTRLDHVLLTFANLHRIFSRLQEEGSSGAGAVLASLEKRWGKTDQEAFILAVFYNPYIRDRLFSGEHTSLTKSGIFGMIRRMFERTFPGETRDVVSFSKAFNDYCDLQGDFSAESLDLDAIEQISEEQDTPMDLLLIWRSVRPRAGTRNGRTQFIDLGIRLLSIIANSAGCERLFSLMGIIHTKLRNRLQHEKVTKTAFLKMELKRAHAEAGLGGPRKKRRMVDTAKVSMEPDADNVAVEAPASSTPTEPLEEATPDAPAAGAEEPARENRQSEDRRLGRERNAHYDSYHHSPTTLQHPCAIRRATTPSTKKRFVLFDKNGTGKVQREVLGDLLRALGQTRPKLKRRISLNKHEKRM